MSDFTTRPVKLSEADIVVNQQKLSYETISKLCNFFTADEPSTYLAYLHYNKGLLTEEEMAQLQDLTEEIAKTVEEPKQLDTPKDGDS